MKNHDYATPEQETADWHIPLNENFNKLDRDVEIRDLESARSEYEPKDGALFRARDTGNVFLGDGSNWQKLNPPADGSGGNSSRLYAIPVSDTIASIQTALDNNPFVRLEPGVLYSGDTQLTIDPVDADDNPTVRCLDARGAGINYTGTKDVAVDILPNYNHSYQGRVFVQGGDWSGAGKYNGTDAVFQFTDHFGVNIEVSRTNDATHGILGKNEADWSEAPKLRMGAELMEGYTGDWYADVPGDGCTYCLRLAGVDSELTADDGGTNSFRDPDVELRWPEIKEDVPGTKMFWQDKAEMQGGNTHVTGFAMGDNHIIVHSDGWNTGHVVRIETEGGDETTVALQNDNDVAPVLVNPRIDTAGGMNPYVNNGAGNMLVYDQSGILDAGNKRRLQFDFAWPEVTVNDKLSVNRDGDLPQTNIEGQYEGSPTFDIETAEDSVNVRSRRSGAGISFSNPEDDAEYATLHEDKSLDIGTQDLSALSLSSSESGRIYRHNGSNAIPADGGTASSPGYYVWDNSTSEFKSIVKF